MSIYIGYILFLQHNFFFIFSPIIYLYTYFFYLWATLPEINILYLISYIYLDKIKHLGITGLAYKLLQSYLLNRQQYAAFKNRRSDLKIINNGVLQGSILGPMLFLIYINDFPNTSKLFNFLMYADDTRLFCCLEDIQSPHKGYTLNQEFQKVYKWLLANKLKLNIAKTTYLIFSKRNKNINLIYLNINDNVIEHVHQFNFLGLHLNSRLTWNTHMEEISKKISRTIGVLKKTTAYSAKKHIIKHIQCTYSATD